MSSKKTTPKEKKQFELAFADEDINVPNEETIKVIELFAGVGGFRIGLDNASVQSDLKYKTVWSNQWEPSSKKQDASDIYCREFGIDKNLEVFDPVDQLPYHEHVNDDINLVPMENIPQHDMLVGGFPCQDYSVASTLNRSGGIEGKKGVLWWSIYKILKDHRTRPKYLFLENVDRLLGSPAKQRGRDFAIILASLAEQGYVVEWRIINAGDYGMQQRRRRTFIVAYREDCPLGAKALASDTHKWIMNNGTIASEFPVMETPLLTHEFDLEKDIREVSANFNTERAKAASPFLNAGMMKRGHVYTVKTVPSYNGPRITLGEILLPEDEVPAEYFISEEALPQWRYQKGAKNEPRVSAQGFEYNYTEGPMKFPDDLDMPSRTIITGEGGASASRFKHVVEQTPGRFRRLTPVELERLDGFPDNHTQGASDVRRAFLMGNALMVSIVEKIGRGLIHQIQSV